MITYAQNFEDVMLARLFAGHDTGFYVDIGAGDPAFLSVTKHFYDQGWHGINVEPLRANWERFAKDRPRDINLNVAVSSAPGRQAFCEVIDNDALSSLHAARIAELAASGARTRQYQVECVTGESLFAQCPAEVDFLKIDVEGSESEVLRSIDFARHRPRVLVIEATAQDAAFPGWAKWSPRGNARWLEWEPGVLAAGYMFVHFDGLNRFYLRDDMRHLAPRLAIPPGVFDFIVPDMQEALNRDRRAANEALREKEAQIALLKAEVERSTVSWKRSDAALREKEAQIATLSAEIERAHGEIQRGNAEVEGFKARVEELLHAREVPPAPVADDDERHRELLAALAAKEGVIKELRSALGAFRAAHGVLQYGILPARGLARGGLWMARLPRRVLPTRRATPRLAVPAPGEAGTLGPAAAHSSPAPSAPPVGERTDRNRALSHDLMEKEAVIQELTAALQAFRASYGVLQHAILPARRLAQWGHWLANIPRLALAPRLGILQQHPPRPLRLPAHYRDPVKLVDAQSISLVTPSFRQAAFIERTILSVLEQSYPSLEYFVQDGGSQDGTRAILERYADRLAGWDSRPDNGQAAAINAGFARTKGEIMGWINSDDVLLPGALACVGDFFQRHPEVDVVYGHRMLIDEDDRQIGRWVMPAHDDAVLSWADFVPQETLFWRRRIWDEAGGRVDESFRFALDWDLLVRFREAGARFVRLPRFLGGFRIHSQQKTSASITEIGFQEMDRIRERVLGRVPSRIEVRNAIAPYMLKHVLSDLPWRIRERLGGAA